jgi:hypothetical protein
VEDVVWAVLGKIADKEARLAQATLGINEMAEWEEQMGEIAAETWLYIERNRLWMAGGHNSINEFKKAIDHNVLQATIERNMGIRGRRKAELRGIARQWGEGLDDSIPDDIRPKYLSENALKNLH